MVKIGSVDISPSIINSSCAWASNLHQLQELYNSTYTGAVTTRTATIDGFKEDGSHMVAFTTSTLSSINSYGYSPHPLSMYLTWIESILSSSPPSHSKPIIISITASDTDALRSMVHAIQSLRLRLGEGHDTTAEKSRIAIELNTSCPNIPNASPSGYAFSSLHPLLRVLADEFAKDKTLTIGLKLPPFVYREQFLEVLNGIKELSVFSQAKNRPTSPFAFFTCTNTLGNSLLFSDQTETAHETPKSQHDFAVPTVLGGLAGEALHALALGNVYNFAQLLGERGNEELGEIAIIGVGGVTSRGAVGRMKKAGASVVGCATLLGREGVQAFEKLN